MVVLSPELPPATAALAVKHSLTFPIVWDQGNAVAEAFGLAFTLPEDLRAVYLSFGNDLAKRNDDPSWRLPMPARFVIDAAGVIRSAEADPDYTTRPEPEATLETLKRVVRE